MIIGPNAEDIDFFLFIYFTFLQATSALFTTTGVSSAQHCFDDHMTSE